MSELKNETKKEKEIKIKKKKKTENLNKIIKYKGQQKIRITKMK
jgi:hypothetical protein